ncbi:AAA family ATPase [Dietzia maris]|uniref:AAA family ATPase n=1 Tax=Dietzia maris TaxID=37915 RepID=UPI0037C99A21
MTYVPPRLRQVIELHIYRNYAVEGLGESPLILGIDGPPGEGKTFAISAVVQSVGIREHLISSGQLESPHSGKPAELIRDSYLSAGSSSTGVGIKGSVLIINDIDGGIGDWGPNVQYTVNRQNASVELMNLCDKPTIVEGVRTPRIPIIVTGNDFSVLYAPLIRSGRMRRFTWIPTLEEKVAIVSEMLPSGARHHAPSLVERHQAAPVSFFADVVSFAKDQLVISALNHRGFESAIDAARDGIYPQVDEALTVDMLDLTAVQLEKQHHNQSHLS